MSLLAHGAQRALAERFGVSEATISRDLAGIYVEVPDPRWCPLCGARALGLEAAEDIGRRFDDLLALRSWVESSGDLEATGPAGSPPNRASTPPDDRRGTRTPLPTCFAGVV